MVNWGVLCAVLIMVLRTKGISNTVLNQETSQNDVINKLNRYSDDYTTAQFGNILLSYQMVSNQHLQILIDQDATDFEEDSNTFTEIVSSGELFDIVTLRTPTTTTRRTTGKPTTTIQPWVYTRNPYNYRTTTTTRPTTTLEPWVHERYTFKIGNWIDSYTMPPTRFEEPLTEEQKLAISIDAMAKSFAHSFNNTLSNKQHFGIDFTQLFNRLNITGSDLT